MSDAAIIEFCDIMTKIIIAGVAAWFALQAILKVAAWFALLSGRKKRKDDGE